MVLLASVQSNFARDQLSSILSDAGIPFLMREKGSGGYLRLFGGSSLLGSEIYVSKADFLRAKELLAGFDFV